VSGVLLGSRWSGVWNADRALAADFFTAKGVVEGLADALGVGTLAAERAEHPAFHPGRSAWLSLPYGERLGIVGELHPEVATALDLPRGVYVFELDGDLLLRHSNEERKYVPPSRFPRALRDVAVVVDRTASSGAIEQVLREAMGEFGRSVRLFDVYTGKPLPEEKVSLAYALELGADDRTLTDEEVESQLTAARERLTAEFGAEFRG
jgi:phenylalanyl-tRNA synthetase beta chain